MQRKNLLRVDKPHDALDPIIRSAAVNVSRLVNELEEIISVKGVVSANERGVWAVCQ
jgi:hypothetical protein